MLSTFFFGSSLFDIRQSDIRVEDMINRFLLNRIWIGWESFWNWSKQNEIVWQKKEKKKNVWRISQQITLLDVISSYIEFLHSHNIISNVIEVLFWICWIWILHVPMFLTMTYLIDRWKASSHKYANLRWEKTISRSHTHEAVVISCWQLRIWIQNQNILHTREKKNFLIRGNNTERIQLEFFHIFFLNSLQPSSTTYPTFFISTLDSACERVCIHSNIKYSCFFSVIYFTV